MPTQSEVEAAVSYAALILADAEIGITAEKLQVLLAAAKVEDVEPIWTTLFAKALENKDIKELLMTVGSAPAAQTQGTTETHPTTETLQSAPMDDGAESNDDQSDDDIMGGLSLFDS